MEQVRDKIVVEQCLDALPQELQIWVASHNPGMVAIVAELIESYDLAHNPLRSRVRTHYQDHRPSSRPPRKDSWQQGFMAARKTKE